MMIKCKQDFVPTLLARMYDLAHNLRMRIMEVKPQPLNFEFVSQPRVYRGTVQDAESNVSSL